MFRDRSSYIKIQLLIDFITIHSAMDEQNSLPIHTSHYGAHYTIMEEKCKEGNTAPSIFF
uniref:Uncharacterized protein n=1 Tax=Rhizophora mucronata TaxID=61149 RepID=A0A2P2IPD5_RHIMU